MLLKHVFLVQMIVELVMAATRSLVFYSWQSDLPNVTNRNFILQALENAAKTLRNDNSLQVEPVIDRDTFGVPGSPNISETIFGKIDQARVFVCDISIINQDVIKENPNVRLTPNPNVLLELGYALKALGDKQIILVLNDAYGIPESLPFDLRMRRVTRYHTPKEDQDRASERKRLEGMLTDALRASLSTIDTPLPGEVIQPASRADQARIAIEADRPDQDSLVRQYMADVANRIDSMTPVFAGDDPDEQLLRSVEESTEMVCEFAQLAEIIVQKKATEAGRALYKGFGGILDLYTFPPPPRGLTHKMYDHDFAKFLGHELFVTFFSFLLREERWELMADLLDEDLYARKSDFEQPGLVSFSHLSELLDSLDKLRKYRLKLNRLSPRSDLLNERHTNGDLAKIVPMEQFAEADYFLFVRVQIQPVKAPQWPEWLPWSSLYLRQIPGFLQRAKRAKYAQQLLLPLGVEDISTLRSLLVERAGSLEMAWKTEPFRMGFWDHILAGFDFNSIGSF